MADHWWKYRGRWFQHLLREQDAINLDIGALVDEIERMGANVYISMAGGFSAWYPSKLTSQRVNPYMQSDFLGSLVEEAHRRSIRVVARMDISKCHADALETHPDWFTRQPGGAPNLIWEMPQTCATGPFWAEENFRILDEILGKYPIDGLFYNYFNVGRCYCARCVDLVRRATGADVPAPGVRTYAYEKWRRDLLADYTRQIRDFVRARSSDVALIPYHHLRDGWDYPAMAAAADVVSAQISNPLVVNPVDPQPIWTHWAAEEALLARALKPDVWPMLAQTASGFFASRQTTLPAGRMIRNMIQAAAYGAAAAPAFNGRLGASASDTAQRVADFGAFQAKASVWYENLSSVAEVAILRSQASIDWSSDAGRLAGDPAQLGHVAEFRGAYEMATALRYPCDLIADGTLTAEGLSGYKVVVAPAVSCLSDADASALDAFVAAGGVLIATADFATRDETGAQRTSPACQALPARAAGQRIVSGGYFAIEADDLRAVAAPGRYLAADGPLWRLDNENAAETDLRLVGPFANNAPEFSIVEGDGGQPALFVWSHGDGRVVYLPWRPMTAFHLHAIPDYLRLWGRLLARYAGQPPIAGNAPPAVEIIMAAHPEGEVLHLINGAAAQAKPFVEPPPLAGFELKIKSAAKTVVDLRSGVDFPFRRNGEEIALRIDRLDNFLALALRHRDA